MQIKQRIFKHTDMQVLYFFSRQNFKTFDMAHTFHPLTVAKLSTLKTVSLFWPTQYSNREPLTESLLYVYTWNLKSYGVLWRGPQTYYQPPLTHIICTTLRFFGHTARAESFTDHSRVLSSSVTPYHGTGTADQADLTKLGSAQLNLMLLHLTLVWQLPIIEHKI